MVDKMARLTSLQIYEYLPKKNCGKCGEDTCIAFAMKLYEREKNPLECTEFTEEQKRKIIEVLTPSVREVTIGTRDKHIKIGGEEVIYRHELRFFNPCALFVDISDIMENEEINKRIDFAKNFEFERIGDILKLDGISIRCNSDNPKKFKSVVEMVASRFNGPMILKTFNPGIMEYALKAVMNRRPLLYAANKENWQSMMELAQKYNAPLAVNEKNLSELGTIAMNISSAGFNDIVLDPGIDAEGKGLAETIDKFTMIRRAAVREIRELGFPVMGSTVPIWINSNDEVSSSFYESTILCMLINRFASLLVFHTTDIWAIIPALVLRYNIYTDPRVEPTVEAKLYEIGSPDENSPVFITTNFALTYSSVVKDIESTNIASYLLVIDTEGLAVAVSLAGEKLTASVIKKALEESKISERVKHKKLIIPGVAAKLKHAIEDETDWKVLVGPGDSSQIGSFLKENWK
ncbi:MAG TPA: acetyl-CoA decarbonylase/synthase complex subunit gamma [Candidatus Altiarchaeales archaeon]|nr:acetyl-CoA decarbonylase/synthase complex subunit gamma [Candidatus Altiarchaeales archaeon]